MFVCLRCTVCLLLLDASVGYHCTLSVHGHVAALACHLKCACCALLVYTVSCFSHGEVEELVAQHNRCGGKLWVGGSQPPLLLAFLNLKPGEEKDYIE